MVKLKSCFSQTNIEQLLFYKSLGNNKLKQIKTQ